MRIEEPRSTCALGRTRSRAGDRAGDARFAAQLAVVGQPHTVDALQGEHAARGALAMDARHDHTGVAVRLRREALGVGRLG
jgi:hypothetical protein